MSGTIHPDPDVPVAQGIIDRCMAVLAGNDAAVVLGVLTSLVTLALDDTGVPLDVFVTALRGSDAKLRQLKRARARTG